mmetsp:Transcript_12274/g.26547  ORF Transcript_12274/g.26547 Transcript_12274/m.26547 type:complete len:139 (-) Transcript_12274:91-507(-)|eukprot:CAMPEP_0172555030 /NCGR_PEP_ID=MMETSP1067-20121228/57652_1 /TAXON_ID=265564 ORGANISM="Thalassiosira punctigera, Strain Tpunct2005C2" /NCGR_SAMPLE_ID=MMETSP1067 /ASSEMBLY_ACC=CAM_ASM_000444 /LENGTH=138 /DNA_ID=CAMNT_0013343529 /DNA_START=69 /DNA_END=485 /DNA_ORIENTATION=-
MKSASIAVLLLASVASAQHNETETDVQHPCSAQFMAVDAYCDGDRSNTDECFSTCMAERGVLDAYEMPSCPGLASTLCACAKKCAPSDVACGNAMIATVECNLVNEFGCAGHGGCPKAFALTSSFGTMMKAAGARLRK